MGHRRRQLQTEIESERKMERGLLNKTMPGCKSILIETATKQLKLSSFVEPKRDTSPLARSVGSFRLWFSVGYKLNFDTKLN